MKTNAPGIGTEKSILERLADRVQELHLEAQRVAPLSRGEIYARYRKAYLAYREHKDRAFEQDALLLATAV